MGLSGFQGGGYVQKSIWLLFRCIRTVLEQSTTTIHQRIRIPYSSTTAEVDPQKHGAMEAGRTEGPPTLTGSQKKKRLNGPSNAVPSQHRSYRKARSNRSSMRVNHDFRDGRSYAMNAPSVLHTCTRLIPICGRIVLSLFPLLSSVTLARVLRTIFPALPSSRTSPSKCPSKCRLKKKKKRKKRQGRRGRRGKTVRADNYWLGHIALSQYYSL